ncbi:MAG: carboxylating nicotinate-nucleotide diphosphorylase [Alphaproteobacteria bacterium PRO2]|nr:carboxylating nicotinate-nucleotide diphosphorylase [Alphaproteobacteria bacterium PRO2]
MNALLIEKLVREALMEDLGHGRDVTSELLIPSDASAKAVLRARAPGIIAGLIVGLSAFTLSDGDFEITLHANDGETVEAGQDIAEIEGPARPLLTAERTALNFIQQMSGVATLTGKYVEKIKGTHAKITCTRKTVPNLRALQKYAVRCGGGHNHRSGLDDMILIKDNHIAVAGGIEAALDLVSNAGHGLKIEIEVDTLKQLEAVLKHGGADIVMLDNFKPADLKKAVSLAKGKIVTEASGGVTLETVRAIAETGVDYISVGALTHSAPALDMGLDIDI